MNFEVIENCRESIIFTNHLGKIVYANNAVEKETSYTKEEMLDKKPGELWGGNMSESFYKEMWETISIKKMPFTGEATNFSKKSKQFNKSLFVAPILTPNLEISHYVQVLPQKNTKVEEFKNTFYSIMKKRSQKTLINLLSAFNDEINTFSNSISLIESSYLPNKKVLINEDKYLLDATVKSLSNFENIYLKYKDLISYFIFTRVGKDINITEELTQEVFFRALKNLNNYEFRHLEYKSYLLKIARNLIVDFYIKTKKNISIDRIPDDPVFEQFQGNFSKTSFLFFDFGLSKLEKKVLKMKYEKDMTVKLISKKLGKTENSIKLLLSRGRKKIKIKLKNKKDMSFL